MRFRERGFGGGSSFNALSPRCHRRCVLQHNKFTEYLVDRVNIRRQYCIYDGAPDKRRALTLMLIEPIRVVIAYTQSSTNDIAS